MSEYMVRLPHEDKEVGEFYQNSIKGYKSRSRSIYSDNGDIVRDGGDPDGDQPAGQESRADGSHPFPKYEDTHAMLVSGILHTEPECMTFVLQP